MRIIGVTGGVGCGKSEVLQFLQDTYHANICQLDVVAKNLQKKGGICFEKIVEYFGEEIIGGDGELDRGRLAEIVFQDETKLMALNEMVHPEVKKWVQQDIQKRRTEKVPLYIIEAALFPAAGYEDICREMWYIYAEEQVRRERLMKSRGYSSEKITHMMELQPTEAQFRAISTAVIDNSGTFENTKEQIGVLL